MKQKTLKENFGYPGKITVRKKPYRPSIELYSRTKGGGGHTMDLTPKRARELFTVGLQMCDELEDK